LRNVYCSAQTPQFTGNLVDQIVKIVMFSNTIRATYLWLLPITFALLILGPVSESSAHSGGLNSSGCHAGSRPYHCHRSPSDMVRTLDGRNRLRCDLGSRSKECVGSGYQNERIRIPNQGIRKNNVYEI
jgi:hypothetical protein